MGTPSLEWILVAANVGVLICLGVVHVTQDQATAESGVLVVPAERSAPPVLVVVSADNPADLVIGEPAAVVLGGALVTIPSGGLDETTRHELSGLRPDRLLVLGGADAVSEVTVRELEQSSRATVTRLAGADRYATAAKVATTQFPAPVARLRVMSGEDADAPGPRAELTTDAPVLLVEAERIPASVAAAMRLLRPQSIEVAGAPAAVSDAVLRQLERFTTGRVVRRGGPS